MTSSDCLSDLLVHEQPMRLLSELISVDQNGACCIAEVKADLPFVDSSGNLPGWVGIELMAQTIAVWGGWQARNEHRDRNIGLLLGSRKYESNCETFSTCARLVVNADLVIRDGNMGVFQCTIADGAQVVAKAQVNAYMPDSSELQQVLERKS